MCGTLVGLSLSCCSCKPACLPPGVHACMRGADTRPRCPHHVVLETGPGLYTVYFMLVTDFVSVSKTLKLDVKGNTVSSKWDEPFTGLK